MVEITTFLQSTIVAKFILPFLLVFFVVFAVLEKIKLLGEDKKQLNALVAFVIGLIFVGAVFPKEVVGNLVLFLSIESSFEKLFKLKNFSLFFFLSKY